MLTATAKVPRFTEWTTTWYDRLKAYPGDLAAIRSRVQNDSSKYHVRQLRAEVAAIDADFVEPLLEHIDAVLRRRFRGEFSRTFKDECYHECTDSAAARLFSSIRWATGRREQQSAKLSQQ